MTDTPALVQTYPPIPRSEMVKSFLGDLARPFAIYATSAGATAATIIIAQKITSATEGAVFIGAVFLGVGTLYGAKSFEVAATAKQDAIVKVAQAQPGAVTP